MQPMRSELLRPTGRAEILIRRAGLDGPWRVAVSGPNLVVNGMLREQIRAIAKYGPAADYKISEVRLGSNGAPPQPTDSGVTGPTAVATVTAYSYPSASSVRLEGLLAAGSSNGLTFQEMGLYMANGIMVARKAFAAMTKDELFEWLLRWTLNLT